MSFFILYCILLKNDSLFRILRFPGYFETPLFRTFFHFPWDFEIAGFHCSRTPLFRTRLIRSPRYFEGRSNSLGFTLMFSVIYYQLFRTRLFRIPRYFELIVLSLHLRSTLLFRTCQKQSTYIRAQLETYCILIWARTEHSKIFQCNSICWFIRHIITVFLFNQCLSSYSTVFY